MDHLVFGLAKFKTRTGTILDLKLACWTHGKLSLPADKSFAAGDYTEPPTDGLHAFARVYTGWVLLQIFFRYGVYKEMGLGLESIADVVEFSGSECK